MDSFLAGEKNETVIIQGSGTMIALVINNSGIGLKRDGELNIGRKSGLSTRRMASMTITKLIGHSEIFCCPREYIQ